MTTTLLRKLNSWSHAFRYYYTSPSNYNNGRHLFPLFLHGVTFLGRISFLLHRKGSNMIRSSVLKERVILEGSVSELILDHVIEIYKRELPYYYRIYGGWISKQRG